MIALQAICALVLAFSCLSLAEARRPSLRFSKQPDTAKPTCSEHGELLPDPRNCSKFLTCIQPGTIHENVITNDCPAGLHFNTLQKICDWPNNTNCKTTDDKSTLERENQKLKQEKEALEKEVANLKAAKISAEHKISSLEDDNKLLEKETNFERLDYEKGTTGATTSGWLDGQEAVNAFSNGTSNAWVSSEEVPQMIWIQLSKATRVKSFSFRSSVSPLNGASKFQFLASNDIACASTDKLHVLLAKWDVLLDDQSGSPFKRSEDTKFGEVCPIKAYKCYGFKVMDVGAETGKTVSMNHIKMWTKD